MDFSRGVLRLEVTKSGRRREIPMNRAVYDALTELPGPKAEGLVFTKRGRGGLGEHPHRVSRAPAERPRSRASGSTTSGTPAPHGW